MPVSNPSKSRDAEIAGILSAILTLKHEEGGEYALLYRPGFRQIAGSTSGAILLSQIWFYFQKKTYEPFYKFVEPCNHKWYKAGDSWTETLGWGYREFTTALKKIGTKVTSGTSKADAYNNSIVIYWTDSNQMTWFDMNLINFAQAIVEVYGENPLGNLPLSNYLERLQREITQISPDRQLPLCKESFKDSTNPLNVSGDSASNVSGKTLKDEGPNAAHDATIPAKMDSDKKEEPKYPHGEELFNHPMVVAIRREFRHPLGTAMPKEVVNQLQQECWNRPEGATGEAHYGYLTDRYDNTPGFKTFFKERLDQWTNAGVQQEMERFVNHLRNFGAKGKWKGWLIWKEQNKALCMVDPKVEYALVPNDLPDWEN
jgi:hypothetical protein